MWKKIGPCPWTIFWSVWTTQSCINMLCSFSDSDNPIYRFTLPWTRYFLHLRMGHPHRDEELLLCIQNKTWWMEVPGIIWRPCTMVTMAMWKMCIYGAASPTPPPPPLWMGHGPPPPLWLWGCGGALLVSDAADFLWFLVPPPPPVDVWMGHGGGGGAGSMYINIYVYMNISICICIWWNGYVHIIICIYTYIFIHM